MIQIVKITISLLAVLLILTACSQAGKQKVLAFFFDGVESPDSTQSNGNSGSPMEGKNTEADEYTQSTQNYFYHAIYAEKECGICHDSEKGNQLTAELPDLCYQCHTNFSEEYENLHVPIAMGECGECHHAHMARNEKLLLSDTQTLCFACHEEADIRASETHSEIGETDCTECHNPHGSDNENLFY
jgi:predicted CXXCH cytochrome family protein